jgi:hypothetical protein
MPNLLRLIWPPCPSDDHRLCPAFITLRKAFVGMVLLVLLNILALVSFELDWAWYEDIRVYFTMLRISLNFSILVLASIGMKQLFRMATKASLYEEIVQKVIDTAEQVAPEALREKKTG